MNDKHTEELSALKRRHATAIEGFSDTFSKGRPATEEMELWVNKWLTTPQQFQFLSSLVESLEAAQKGARAASQNLKLGLQTIIAANTPGALAASAR